MNEFNKKREEATPESEYAFRSVISGETKTKLWSIIALTLSILSVALCYFGWVGIIFSVLALGMAIFSRKRLGYFDKMTLASIIVAIFGAVFSVAMLILKSIGM